MMEEFAHEDQEQLSLESISDPLVAQVLNLYDEGDLLLENFLLSEDSTSSPVLDDCAATGTNYQHSLEDPTTTTALSSLPSMDSAASSELFDVATDDLSFDVLPPTNSCYTAPLQLPIREPYISQKQHKHLNHIILTDTEVTAVGYSSDSLDSVVSVPVGLLQQQDSSTLPAFYQEFSPQLPSTYISFNPSQHCSFLDSSTFYANASAAPACNNEDTCLFNGSVVEIDAGIMSQELMLPQMPTSSRSGLYTVGSSTTYSYSNEVIGDNQHYLINDSNNNNTPTVSADVPSTDEPTFKVGRLSVEERREKINRYMKKRTERNFSKKIKYECRKTLADSRPRVRGRFAKNDELGDLTCASSSHNKYDDHKVTIKEDDLLDSSDIFAHISGVNSFKYNFAVESWI